MTSLNLMTRFTPRGVRGQGSVCVCVCVPVCVCLFYSRMYWGPEPGTWAGGSHSRGCSARRSRRQPGGWRQSAAAGYLPVNDTRTTNHNINNNKQTQ